MAVLMFGATAANAASTVDSPRDELNRFESRIADGMWVNGHITTVTAAPDATDTELIDVAAQQLNKNPSALKTWKILISEHVSVGPTPMYAPRYLLAVIDSDQGLKIVAVRDGQTNGEHWARLYNCDAVFTCPMSGGTPLIR